MTTILNIPGSNLLNPFSVAIQNTLISTNDAAKLETTSKELVDTISKSADLAQALWELWDTFFNHVVYSSTSYEPFITLLGAIRAQLLTQPRNNPTRLFTGLNLNNHIKTDGMLHWSRLPQCDWAWRDIHDILQDWRDWDGVREPRVVDGLTSSSLSRSGGELYMRFCAFSASLLKASEKPIAAKTVWVFYACRDVLVREPPQSGQPKTHGMAPEQLWALDVRITTTWVRDGAQALCDTNREELREHWDMALDKKTDMWLKEDGLTRERWELWEARLCNLSRDRDRLDETREMAAGASEVTGSILRGA